MAEDQDNLPTPPQRARKAFEMLCVGDDAAIDLGRAALLIAAEEYPDLDIAHYLAQLDVLAMQARAALGVADLEGAELSRALQERDPLSIIEAINQVLFVQEHFRGSSKADYYNPRNSFLNDVLERRIGIPITLSLVYMEVGRRLGVQIDGIGMPLHFLVAYRLSERRIYIDAYEQGRILTEKDCQERVQRMFKGKVHFNQRWLQPISHRQILVRMLDNLKYIYIARGDDKRALAVCDRLVLLAPRSAIERRDRGRLYIHLKMYGRALRDLKIYLELASEGEDVEEVQKQVSALRQFIAMMN
ncbi:MAG TPA: transglutaminase-like domain-containing protein [Ktedonobacteraceae bacterium]|nr:transglutaminase-like domain-containing protein [Ktedonobacteraceae bacterium]